MVVVALAVVEVAPAVAAAVVEALAPAAAVVPLEFAVAAVVVTTELGVVGRMWGKMPRGTSGPSRKRLTLVPM